MKDSSKSRRHFVKSFAFGSVSALIGPPWAATLLTTLLSETRATATTNGQLVLQLTNFPALLTSYGSVRVSVNPIDGSSPNGDFYPFIVTRGSGNTFFAVSSNCTHRGCITDPYDGISISCPCHGSEFAMNGSVINGPAQTNLTGYAIAYDGINTLTVTVPGLGYSIVSYALSANGTSQMKLVFPTFNHASYEVCFRQRFTDAWTVVPFATTPGGPAVNTVLAGTGSIATVYANRTTAAGFYAISILITEV